MIQQFIMYNMWQSNLISDLADTEGRRYDINTLEQVDNSGLEVAVWDNKLQFLKSQSQQGGFSVDESLFEKVKRAKKLNQFSDNYGQTAILIPEIVGVMFDSSDKLEKKQFHKVKTALYEYYKAMMVRKDFPFIEEFNRIVTGCLENGLNVFWRQQIIHDGNIMTAKIKPKQMQDTLVLQFKDMSKFFVYLLRLYCVAFVVFICELGYRRVLGFIMSCLMFVLLSIKICYMVLSKMFKKTGRKIINIYILVKRRLGRVLGR
jgi:hypothetical protein